MGRSAAQRGGAALRRGAGRFLRTRGLQRRTSHLSRGYVGSSTFSSLSPLSGPPPLTLRSPTRDDSLSGQLATWSETFDAQTSSWAWLVTAQTQKIRGATRPASCHLHTLPGPFPRSNCPRALGDRQERSQWGRGERGEPCPETDACSWWQYWDCSEGNSPSPVPLLSL